MEVRLLSGALDEAPANAGVSVVSGRGEIGSGIRAVDSIWPYFVEAIAPDLRRMAQARGRSARPSLSTPVSFPGVGGRSASVSDSYPTDRRDP